MALVLLPPYPLTSRKVLHRLLYSPRLLTTATHHGYSPRLLYPPPLLRLQVACAVIEEALQHGLATKISRKEVPLLS